jgi:PAS domain S-box-containing protein
VADNIIASDQERRSEIERTLHESERQFRLLVDSVADYAIFMLDTDGRIVTWNSGAARIKVYDAGEIIGHDHSRFYTEEDRANGLPATALATARERGRHEADGWRVRKEGGRFWANVVVEAIRGDDGQLIGFSKVTRDITERREAQARDARFRRVVETAPNAIVMIDASGRIEMVNAQAEQIFGHAREEMLGRHVEMLVPQRFRASHPALRRSFRPIPRRGRWAPAAISMACARMAANSRSRSGSTRSRPTKGRLCCRPSSTSRRASGWRNASGAWWKRRRTRW